MMLIVISGEIKSTCEAKAPAEKSFLTICRYFVHVVKNLQNVQNLVKTLHTTVKMGKMQIWSKHPPTTFPDTPTTAPIREKKTGCVLVESHQSGLNHNPSAANEPWTSCAFIGPQSTDNQNCARYTRVEITQNYCSLKGAKLLMQHVESMLQKPAAFWEM